ncbi:MAG: threonine aldolase, partial [Sphingobium sp.]
MPISTQQFASDNYAGACPEALDAMLAANSGSATAYGEDEWTQRAADNFRTLFGGDAEV